MKKKIRYAVIGLGHIAQTAVLPAFKHAKNSKLVALITGDPKKNRELMSDITISSVQKAILDWKTPTNMLRK